GKLPSLEKIESGRDKLLAALGSVKGVRLKMNVDKQINSELTIDFDENVDALGDSAKLFVIDALNSTDLYDPQIEKWEFRASGKTIVGKGVSDPAAISRLMAILAPDDIAASETATAAKLPKNTE